MALAMRRGPHWLLSDADAKDYGQKLSNALRHLPVTMAQKYIDYSALGLAVFTYETPRIAADMQLRAQRQAARRPAQGAPQGPARVFQFAPKPATETPPPPPPPPTGFVAEAFGMGPPSDMTYEPDMGAAQ